MIIQEYTFRNRRDFSAIYECEGCGHKQEGGGYDDRFFHDTVVPNMKCGKCGETSLTLGTLLETVPTRYAEGEVV